MLTLRLVRIRNLSFYLKIIGDIFRFTKCSYHCYWAVSLVLSRNSARHFTFWSHETKMSVIPAEIVIAVFHTISAVATVSTAISLQIIFRCLLAVHWLPFELLLICSCSYIYDTLLSLFSVAATAEVAIAYIEFFREYIGWILWHINPLSLFNDISYLY